MIAIPDVNPDFKDEHGKTALMYAAESGNEAAFRVLLNTSKLEADARSDSGRTPISFAAGNGSTTIAKLLLNTGKVNVDSRSKDS